MFRTNCRSIRALPMLCVGAVFGLLVSDALADGLRCGSRFVSKGDRTFRVLRVCGEPDAVNKRVRQAEVRRTVRVRCSDNPKRWCSVTDVQIIDIPVEEWTYDLGRQRLLHHLTFEEGRLISVATAGYGEDDD